MSEACPAGRARSAPAASAFATAVVLVKREVFDALEACALAERALLRCGRAAEAAGIASLFEMLEDRVVLDPLASGPTEQLATGTSGWPGYAEGAAGSNSRDSELTQ